MPLKITIKNNILRQLFSSINIEKGPNHNAYVVCITQKRMYITYRIYIVYVFTHPSILLIYTHVLHQEQAYYIIHSILFGWTSFFRIAWRTIRTLSHCQDFGHGQKDLLLLYTYRGLSLFWAKKKRILCIKKRCTCIYNIEKLIYNALIKER